MAAKICTRTNGSFVKWKKKRRKTDGYSALTSPEAILGSYLEKYLTIYQRYSEINTCSHLIVQIKNVRHLDNNVNISMLFSIVTLSTLFAHDKISKYLFMSYIWRGKLHVTPTPLVTITYPYFHTCQTKTKIPKKVV